jgi:L-ascorbate metabolism protein UlaG (beta-lactamase superfamily)
MTTIRWLGHSAFHIQTPESSLLIDPFFTGNPKAPDNAKDIRADFILVSHGHGDHVGDALEIAKRDNATIITNYEIAGWFEAKGVKAHGMQHGGGFQFPFGRCKLTLAFHGSALPDGANGGNPAGFLITFNNGKTFYDAADTGLFGDMRLIGDHKVDVAALPIGDNYTMGPDDALKAVEFLRPGRVIPIHYNTFPIIEQDTHKWAHDVRSLTTCQALVLEIGGSVEM